MFSKLKFGIDFEQNFSKRRDIQFVDDVSQVDNPLGGNKMPEHDHILHFHSLPNYYRMWGNCTSYATSRHISMTSYSYHDPRLLLL